MIYADARKLGALPIGLAKDCRLKQDVRRGELITHAMVETPAGSLLHRLRAEQDRFSEVLVSHA
jgi:predicted homoserine dehydrogenase-like protein